MRTKLTFPALLTGLLLWGPLGVSAQTFTVSSPTTTSTSTTINTTAAASVGQTITVYSKTYVVNAKKVLGTGMEYYTATSTTPRSTPVYFVRTNNRYNATGFTQAQYEAFLSTGKISSFGTIKQRVVNGKTIKYVTRGTAFAAFSSRVGGMNMFEFASSSVLALAADDNGGGTGCNVDVLGKELCCRMDCICFDPGCADNYAKCVAACSKNTSLIAVGFLHSISTTKVVLFQ